MRRKILFALLGLSVASGAAFAADWTMKTLTKDVAATATPEALSATSLKVYDYTVIAKPSNTGAVWVGWSDVDAATENGIRLLAGQSMSDTPIGNGKRPVLNLDEVYVDVEVNGEGVTVAYHAAYRQ